MGCSCSNYSAIQSTALTCWGRCNCVFLPASYCWNCQFAIKLSALPQTQRFGKMLGPVLLTFSQTFTKFKKLTVKFLCRLHSWDFFTHEYSCKVYFYSFLKKLSTIVIVLLLFSTNTTGKVKYLHLLHYYLYCHNAYYCPYC